MNTYLDSEPNRLIKQLRDQIARLITENLELRRQLEDLRRAKTDAPVESLAASAIRSVRLAENQINAQAGDDHRYTISDMQTRFQGILVMQDETLAFRAPLPEYGTAPGHLGSIQMSFAKTPTLPGQSTGGEDLRPALERLQATFLSPEAEKSSKIAGVIVNQTILLLSTDEPWRLPDFNERMLALAEALVRHGDAAEQTFAPEMAQFYQQAAAYLQRKAQAVLSVGQATPDDLQTFAYVLGQLLLALAG